MTLPEPQMPAIVAGSVVCTTSALALSMLPASLAGGRPRHWRACLATALALRVPLRSRSDVVSLFGQLVSIYGRGRPDGRACCRTSLDHPADRACGDDGRLHVPVRARLPDPGATTTGPFPRAGEHAGGLSHRWAAADPHCLGRCSRPVG